MHDAHKRWPGRSLRMYPGKLNINVLPAIDTTGWSAQTMDEHLAQVHGTFAAALEPHQQPASENTVPKRKRSMG